MDHRIGFVRFAVAAASAVADWHERHGVHGRLRPHALIVDSDGHVRLCEFRPTTQELAYLAPEQTGRLIRGVDERTDLYALGVVLYERLTGRLPFDALDALEWVHCHLARRPIPPAQLVPDIGPMLQQLLLRLLAKQPEERYQTARGLVADLDRCLADLTATGQVTPFPLGQSDVPDRLVLTGRPYGRQRELAALRAAFERAAAGGNTGLVCLAGDPGIGKSTLITGLVQPIALAGGRLLVVRFDPRRPAPFAMIAEPLAELAGQLLAESEERLARWRVRLNTALGSAAGVLVDLVPALAQILGTQAPAQLSARHARRRLYSAVSRLLGELAGPDRPLVLALDDLHHADPASLELLQYLLTEAGCQYLLVVATYRVDEARGRKALATMLDELESARLASTIEVGPLPEPALAQVLAETLRCDADLVEPLASVVAAKTGANPLFVGQFLHRMRDRRLLVFEPKLPGWTWNRDAIAQEPVTDNVVDLVARRIDLLPAEVRQALTAAALFGHHFDAVTLSQVSRMPLTRLTDALHRATRERLVQPIDSFAASADHGRTPAPGRAMYRWQHDRIRDAVWSRIPVDELPARRLATGRALRAWLGDREETLFDVVGHLNAAVDLLSDPAERVELARLNLAAAARAARAGAHESALGHAETGLRLLPGDAWTSRYDLALPLHVEAARMAAVTGNRARAEELFDATYANATDVDRVGVLRQRMRLALDHGEQHGQSLELGLRALALLGYEVPDDPKPRAEASLAALRTRLAGLRVADVAEAPPMTDPTALATAGFLAELLALLLADSDRLALITTMGVELTLTHGLSEAAATFFAYHSAVSANRRDDDTARWSGQLAVRLIDRLLADEWTPRMYGGACTIVTIVAPMWYDGPEPMAALAHRVERRAAEQGDPFIVGYLRLFRGVFGLWQGAPLGGVAAQVDTAWDALKGAQLELLNLFTRSAGDAVAGLRGAPNHAAPPTTPSEEALAALALKGALGWISASVMNDAILVAFHEDDHREVVALAEVAWALPTSPGTIWYAELAFYYALSLATLYPEANPDQRPAWWARLDELHGTFERWSRRSPIFAAHKALLVSAERARLTGNAELATARYDQAIGAAREQGMTHVEAIAAELAARYARQRGDVADAANYLHRAVACYERWGAHAKVARLEEAAAALRC